MLAEIKSPLTKRPPNLETVKVIAISLNLFQIIVGLDPVYSIQPEFEITQPRKYLPVWS